jgi:hypothetical protein
MRSRDREASEIQRRIGDLLLRHWDPIGIKDEPQAQNEYDSYVGGVYRLLVSGASAEEIAKHLADTETKQLGFEDTELGRCSGQASERVLEELPVPPWGLLGA